MGTRYVWTTPPTWNQQVAIADFDHIKKVIFGGKDTPELQLVNFGQFHCVVFTTKELSYNNPYDTFYLLHTRVGWVTDEGTGGHLT